MPFVRLLREDRRRPESNYLTQYARTVTSQHGEDGILEKLFSIIGTNNKWCVEFGAWDGKTHSNTYNLIVNHGWSSVQIEGNKTRYAALRNNHGDNPRVHCLHTMIGFNPRADSVDFHLRQLGAPKDIDFISIDIDGNDYHIFHSISYHRPRVVMIEFNPVMSNEIVFYQDRDFSINQGCSLRALVELAKLRGYELACVISANAIFVTKDEYPKLEIADNNINAMFMPTRDARLFVCFDGTLINVGLGEVRLRAPDPKPRKIDPLDFQVWDEADRGFGGRVPDELKI